MGERKSIFDNELFCDADIAIIREKVEQNLPILFSNDKYIEIDDKLQELNIELTSILNNPDLEMFQKYIKINTDLIDYQNCLAYYLGLQAGIKINDLNIWHNSNKVL